jgi:Rrf2 family transcriptional regulator, nitric oxide-sensitive transcriptional repressor
MRLTSFSDYTLRTLIYLGVHPNQLCTIDEIADAYDISANHLMKVVQQAAQAGDVHTVRGQRGGMRLARPPEAINVGAVLRRTEPDLHIAPCFGSGSTCCIQPACVLQGAFAEALAAFMAVVDGMSLADLIRPKRHLSALLRLEAPGRETTSMDSRH